MGASLALLSRVWASAPLTLARPCRAIWQAQMTALERSMHRFVSSVDQRTHRSQRMPSPRAHEHEGALWWLSPAQAPGSGSSEDRVRVVVGLCAISYGLARLVARLPGAGAGRGGREAQGETMSHKSSGRQVEGAGDGRDCEGDVQTGGGGGDGECSERNDRSMHIVVEWEGGRAARSFSLCDVGVEPGAHTAGEAEGQNAAQDECAEIPFPRGSKAEEEPAEGALLSCHVVFSSFAVA